MLRISDSTQIIGEVILLTQCIYSGVCSCMTTVNCTNACWIFQISNSIFFSDKNDADAISSELFRKSSEHLWCFFGRCRNTFGNFTKPGAKRLIFLFQVNLTLALPHANTSMGKQILNIWNGILFISVFIGKWLYRSFSSCC